ncbi:hypothetical protein QBC34DRAFT_396625 [Podospora aff. communis PSN243]|uniref:Secreted protein n=1 Tax=Podospora aff. communis PSN243 TaxID=3040156 RepID=A0AAV9GW79_9PEZI|nr:hypothetical protein QBC34DRAFT_396625 [Podospora aff. communis PSN243]
MGWESNSVGFGLGVGNCCGALFLSFCLSLSPSCSFTFAFASSSSLALALAFRYLSLMPSSSDDSSRNSYFSCLPFPPPRTAVLPLDFLSGPGGLRGWSLGSI